MPQQTNLKQIKEAARARGLNVEWLPETLQGQQGQPPQQGQPMQGQPMQAPPQGYSQTMAAPAGPMPGQAPPAQANLHPEAQAMMEAIGQYQRSTGPYIPFPGGTPTLQSKQFMEGQRQFDEGMAWDRERWEADQAYRNAQLAARAAQSAPMDTWNQIRTIAEDAAKSGMTFDQVAQYIRNEAPYFGGPDNTVEAEKAALMFYEQALKTRTDPMAWEYGSPELVRYQNLAKKLEEARSRYMTPEQLKQQAVESLPPEARNIYYLDPVLYRQLYIEQSGVADKDKKWNVNW